MHHAEREVIRDPHMDHEQSGVINVYHVEKYILPGATAVLFLYLAPIFLITGEGVKLEAELVLVLIRLLVQNL